MARDHDTRKGTQVTKTIDFKAPDSRVKSAAVPNHTGKETRMEPVARSHLRSATSKPEIIEQVAVRLRGCYNEVLMQPIPDRFIDLLSQLEADGAGQTQRGARGVASKKGAK